MVINRNTMGEWVVEALRELGGSATIFNICKTVWMQHGNEITAAGDMFYKWQYEIRWAADNLRRDGVLAPTEASPRGVWQLASPISA